MRRAGEERVSARSSPHARNRLVYAAIASGAVLAGAGGTFVLWSRVERNVVRVGEAWRDGLLDWRLWTVLAVCLALERLRPARRATSPRAYAEDVLWWFLFTACLVTFVRFYLALLGEVHEHVLGGIHVDLAATLGTGGAGVVAFVVGDALAWGHHYIRHRVPALWAFHAVHHSQRSLNAFTDSRVHVVEVIVAETLLFLPAFLLGLPAATIAALGAAQVAYSRFYHSNIRTNLGPLRYVLVTPQSHRVHHSAAPEHRDRNFAVTFSVWDRLFGTAYKGCDAYPATGVEDPRFPVAVGSGFTGLARTFVAQQLHPFKTVLRSSRGSARVAGLHRY